MPRVTTQDLYCGAYIISKGGCLEHVEVAGARGGRPSVTFILSGDGVEELAREFQSGQAQANVAAFKAAMAHLKDVMFATLRQASGQ